MPFQKKNTVEAAPAQGAPEAPKGPRGYVDAKRFHNPLAVVTSLITQLGEVKAGLEGSAKEVAAIEEDRRQEGDVHSFNLKQSRLKEDADFAKVREIREDDFAKREQALGHAEDSLTELLGVQHVVGDHIATAKSMKMALDAKIIEATAKGEKAGKDAAAAGYTIQKKIDDSTAATKLALLEQKNGQLEKENAELKATNTKLLDAQAATNATVADVAKTGLVAAGGMVEKGTSALGTAAGAFPGSSRTPR